MHPHNRRDHSSRPSLRQIAFVNRPEPRQVGHYGIQNMSDYSSSMKGLESMGNTQRVLPNKQESSYGRLSIDGKHNRAKLPPISRITPNNSSRACECRVGKDGRPILTPNSSIYQPLTVTMKPLQASREGPQRVVNKSAVTNRSLKLRARERRLARGPSIQQTTN